MSYTGELDMQISAEEAYSTLRGMMMDIDASIAAENNEKCELLAKSAPSIWTYGFNFQCRVEAVTETTSRLIVDTAPRKWSLIDTQSKRYTNRLLKVMDAYVKSRTGIDRDIMTSAPVQKAFKSVHGHREAFYVIVPFTIVLILILKLIVLNR